MKLGAPLGKIRISKDKAILAYRIWIERATETSPSVLTSIFAKNLRTMRKFVWKRGEDMMSPELPQYPLKFWQGERGFFSFKTKELLLEYLKEWVFPRSSLTTFEKANLKIGAIRIWGQVVEHEKGYRSQFARIRTVRPLNEKKPEPEKKPKLKKEGAWPPHFPSKKLGSVKTVKPKAKKKQPA